MRFRGLLIAGALFIPTLLAQQYPFIAIPNSPRYPLALFLDHHQRLWIGADDGLCYFDGSRFLPIDGLPKANVSAMDEDDEGGIWIASKSGLYRFYKGRLEQKFKVPIYSVVVVAPDAVVAAGPVSGTNPSVPLYRLLKTSGEWRPELLPAPSSDGNLSGDRNRTLLYPCGAGAWCEIEGPALSGWRAGTPLAITKHAYAGDLGELPVKRLLRDRFGCVWFRNETVVAYQCPGDAETHRLPLTIAESNFLTHMHEASDGSLLLASVGLLAVGRPGAFRVASLANGAPLGGDAVMARDGTIWIASEQGVFRFLYPFRMEYWTERDGLGVPWSATRIGKHVYAAGGKGVLTLSEDRSHWVPVPGTAEMGSAMNILPGPNQTLFVSLAYHSVVQIREDGTIVRQWPPGLKRLLRLVQTPDGRIWGVGNGIEQVLLKDGQLELVEEDLPPPHTLALDIEVDSKGRIWSCYSGGLVYRDDKGWRVVTLRDGLLQNQCRSLAVHPNGDVWFAYNSIPGFARIRFHPGGAVEVRNYRSPQVQGTQIDIFDADSRGWLWRGDDGMYVADPTQAESGSWLHVETDGLGDVNTNQQAFFDDPDGSVWFAAGTALKHFYPPADLLHPSRAPDVFISAFSWGGGAPKIAETVAELPHRSDVRIHVGSLQSDRRNEIGVRYRIAPGDGNWRDAGLDFDPGPLPWGKRTLEVQARIGDGPWSASVMNSVVIARPIWLSWPSIAAVAGLLALGLIRFRAHMERRARARRPLPDLALWRETVYNPEAQELAGSILDSRYQIGMALARGGFATVLQCLDREENRRCAIKVFRRELLDAGLPAGKFDQEVSALQAVEHPNVVRIYGHGTTPEGAPYLVMEFIEGETLRDLIEAEPLETQLIAAFVRQAGSALEAIHAQGIFHRDLKPENIMIRSGRESQLVLIDFSIAIIKDPDQSLKGLSRAAGTIGYMTPEHSIGYADSSTDIYNLAKLIIEMLTGHPLSSLVTSASLDLPERVRALCAELPVSLSPASIDLIAKALEFHPSNRLHDAREFADAIAADLESLAMVKNQDAS